MNDFRLWAQGSKYYEQLRGLDKMNELLSYVLKPLDSMNNSGLWMTWTTLGHERLRVVVDMNDTGPWAQGSKFYKQL